MKEHGAECRGTRRSIGEDQAVPELGSQLQGRWPGMKLPGLAAIRGRRGNDAVLVCACEGADERPARGFAPFALVRWAYRPPCRKVHWATGDIALNACRLELPQGKPPIADQCFVVRELLIDLLKQTGLQVGLARVGRLAPHQQAGHRQTLCA